MSAKYDKELADTQALFDLLRGETPEGCTIAADHQPRLTADQAWTVIWWLGNEQPVIGDRVERCDVCGELYHAYTGGDCVDGGPPPYCLCNNCRDGTEAVQKRRLMRRLEKAQARCCKSPLPATDAPAPSSPAAGEPVSGRTGTTARNP